PWANLRADYRPERLARLEQGQAGPDRSRWRKPLSPRVVLVSLGGNAQALATALARLDLSVSLARDLNAALAELAGAQLMVVEAGDIPSLALLCRRINDEAGSSHPPILAVVPARDVETRVKVLESGAD